MDLTLVLQNNNNAGLLWCGISGKQVGKLEPNASLTLDLSMIAIRSGLQVRIVRERPQTPHYII